MSGVSWRRNGLELVGKGTSGGSSVDVDSSDCAVYPTYTPNTSTGLVTGRRYPKIRLALTLTTLLFCSTTLAQTLYCPSNPQPFYEDDGVNPLDLIWDLSDGGTAKVLPGDVVETVLFAKYSGTESTCQIDAVISYYDSGGNLIAEDFPTLDSQNSIVAVERQLFTEQSLIFDVRGTASGCTRQELRSFSVNTGTLRNDGAFVADAVANDFSTFTVKSRQAHKPVFRRLIEYGMDGAARRGPVLQLACPGGGNPQPFYKDDGVDPLDLIWDLDDGGTSEAQSEDAELIIFVTPRVLFESCRGPDGDFPPKVQIDVVVTDQDGTITMLEDELTASRPIATFDFEGVNGGRKQYHFSVNARSPSCVAARGGNVGAGVRVGVIDSGVDLVQRFPITVRRVPPDPILER